METTLLKFGENIKKIREDKELSQEAFCVGLVALLIFFCVGQCVVKKSKCATKCVGIS